MKSRRRGSAELELLLQEKKACTLEELMSELGTKVRMTVWRGLAQLPYLTSYSHRGRYYALKPSANSIALVCGRIGVPGSQCMERSWRQVRHSLIEPKRAIRGRVGRGAACKNPAGAVAFAAPIRVYREKLDGVFIYVSFSSRIVPGN